MTHFLAVVTLRLTMVSFELSLDKSPSWWEWWPGVSGVIRYDFLGSC